MCHTSRGWLFAAAFSLSIISVESQLFAADAPPAAPGQIVLRETILGPMPSDMRQLTITPDGTRVALIANVGSRVQVLIDGNEGSQFSQIMPCAAPAHGQRPGSTLKFSPDQTCLAYLASKDGSSWQMVVNHKPGPVVDNVVGATFSPVGHRLAYLVRSGGGQAVIVDSTVGPAYPWVWLNELWFSPDGKHVAYAMKTGEGTNGIHAVLDGQPGPGFANLGNLTFSPDGNHLAYIANTGNLQDNCVVVDGKAGPIFPVVRVPIVFSPDGSHYAYTAAPAGARRADQWVVVIDGQVSPEFVQVGVPTFSPDSKHSVYWASEVSGRHTSTYAIVDGKKSMDYTAVGPFLYSPDSQYLAYLAKANSGKAVVVLDGRESEAHQQIDGNSIQFSPDGKRLAFVAQDPDGFHAVVDGKTGPPHQAIEPGSLRFTPDGQHYHYKSRGYSNWAVVVDGVAPSEDAPSEMVTSRDGRHAAAVVIKNPESSTQTCRVLLDGKPVGSTFASVQQLQLSPDGTRVAFVANFPAEAGKKGTYVVVDGKEGAPLQRVDRILFSPDGKHLAAVARDGAKEFVLLDGFQTPAYDMVLASGFPEAMHFRADGSLDYLAAVDKQLRRVVIGPDAIAALPKPAEKTGAAAAAAPGYGEVHAFGKVEDGGAKPAAPDGAKPQVLAAAPDGTLFGATTAGGQYQKGVLFRVKPDGTGYAILHPFEGGQGDGAYPTSIRVGPDGAIYGTLSVEGPNSYGAVYKAAADGSAYTILRPFTGNKDGGAPVIMAVDPDGTLYGISHRNRMPMHLFRIKSDGSDFKSLYDVQGMGEKGVGPFCDGGDGFFYGVSNQTIFKIQKDGTGYAVVYTFKGPPRDLSSPDAAPILGSDGLLYGKAQNGIYKLARDGSGYAAAVVDNTGVLGIRALAEGPDGKLYALAQGGLLRYNRDGSDMAVVHEMDIGFLAPTLVADHGTLFGATAAGNKGGAVFRFGVSGGGGATAAAPTIVVQNVPPARIDFTADVPAPDATIKAAPPEAQTPRATPTRRGSGGS